MALTVNRDIDFRRDHVYRTRSVASNLVTSLEFIAILYATILGHFEQTRNGSAATHFTLHGGAATSSATGDYRAILESFGRNEEPASSNKERTTKKPSLVPRSILERCRNVSDMKS